MESSYVVVGPTICKNQSVPVVLLCPYNLNVHCSEQGILLNLLEDLFLQGHQNDALIINNNNNNGNIVNRGYYMAAQRYEISLRVLKNISLIRCAHS